MDIVCAIHYKYSVLASQTNISLQGKPVFWSLYMNIILTPKFMYGSVSVPTSINLQATIWKSSTVPLNTGRVRQQRSPAIPPTG